jgi:hypothetical protein
MGEVFHHGTGMTWGMSDAVAALAQHRRAIVRVLPAHPANAVKAVWQLADGPEREARGHAIGLDPATGAQVFAVDLPEPPAEMTMRWRPVLSQGGRMLDPRAVGVAADAMRGKSATAVPAPFQSAMPDPSGQNSGQTPATPFRSSHPEPFPFEPHFLFRVTVPFLPDDSPTGETPDGLRFFFALGEGGTVRGPALNGEILHKGGDWMRVRKDGVGLAAIDAVIRPDSGGIILTEYQGIADFGPDAYPVLAAGSSPKRGSIRFTPRYLTAIPALQWLNRIQGLAIGQADLETRLVEYDLYAFGPDGIPAHLTKGRGV